MAECWLKHDSEARMDTALRYIIQKYSVAGSGFYWFVVEMMREEYEKTKRHGIVLDNIGLKVLAGDTGLPIETIQDIIADLLETKLFVFEDGRYISNRLRRDMEAMAEKGEKMRANANKRYAIAEQKQCKSSAIASKTRDKREEIRDKREDKIQEKEYCSEPVPVSKPSRLDGMSFADRWNAFADQCGLPKVININGARGQHLKRRVSEELFVSQFDAILEGIRNSPFLLGDSDRGWKITFDWLVKNNTNYQKILEGVYSAKGPAQSKPTTKAWTRLDDN